MMLKNSRRISTSAALHTYTSTAPLARTVSAAPTRRRCIGPTLMIDHLDVARDTARLIGTGTGPSPYAIAAPVPDSRYATRDA
jgi:hypothetical protein